MTYTIVKAKHLKDQADGNLFEVSIQCSGCFVAFVASFDDLENMISNLQKVKEDGKEYLQHNSTQEAELQ